MRQEVIELIDHGQLPDSDAADEEWLKGYEQLFHSISRPVTDEEACALVKVFGPDDCFGLAWALLHLIETAPNLPITQCLDESTGPWIQRMRDRAKRGGKQR